MNILITTDAFRVGGRETYITTHVREMKARGAGQASLLSPNITGTTPEGFSEVVEIAESARDKMQDWLLTGARFLETVDPCLVWGHHYRSLQTWLLGALSDKPVLMTFHGPLTEQGSVGSRLEALGMALALHRTGCVSAVSQEVAETMRSVAGLEIDVRLIPNRVRGGDVGQGSRRKRTRMLLMTRSQKLGHIRAAVEFVGRWRRTIGPTELVLHRAFIGDRRSQSPSDNRQFFLTLRVLGRRWVCGGFDRFLGSLNTRIKEPTSDPEKEAAQADVVLGMGRALLEGLIVGRPAVLIGYDHVVGLVTNENFDTFSKTNFSGRDCATGRISEAVIDTARALSNRQVLNKNILEKICIECGWSDVWPILTEASELNRPTVDDRKRAEKFLEKVKESSDENRFIDSSLELLRPVERQTFDRLVRYIR